MAKRPTPVVGKNVLDALSDEEYQALKADIAKRGLVTPIVVEKGTGLVVDGAHRWRACQELGIEPRVVEREFASAQAREEEAVLLNMVRRQLGSVAAWGKAFDKLLEVRGVERGRTGRPKAGQARVSLGEVAAELGVPERTARWRLGVWEQLAAHPDLVKAVDAGELPPREALRAAAARAERKARMAPVPAPEPAGERARQRLQPVADTTGLRVLHGDCLDVMRELPDASFASLVTDPPSGADAAGADWDSARGGRDPWISWLRERAVEMQRVLAPGAHGFVWALPRTSHWTATAFEDAGFEIIDVFSHHFAQGLPKASDAGEAVARIDPDARERWTGWRAGVAPASEHWLLVRNPLAAANIGENLLDHGVGALNIEAARVGERWPRNVLFSHAPACRLVGTREVKANSHWPALRIAGYGRKSAAAADPEREDRVRRIEVIEDWACEPGCPVAALGDSARFVWAAKPSPSERIAGLDELAGRGSPHEALKPISLLQRLIAMCTPSGGHILDPFAGLASVGCATATLSGEFAYTGIEERADYVRLARTRLAHWQTQPAPPNASEEGRAAG